jgi:Cd2+/Zn2+-exporting ATPase
MGIISLGDKIRDDALSSLAELKKKGIKTVLITGDNERTARAIAREVIIDEYHAELLPEDKVRIVRELIRKYGGVNDAPALAEATVGIAMGAIGSDVSLETADVALMKDDLTRLPYLVDLSKKTLEVIKENIIASITIKGGFGILAFPGIVALWLAVAIGDMGLSLAVILNALRLSFVKPNRKLRI